MIYKLNSSKKKKNPNLTISKTTSSRNKYREFNPIESNEKRETLPAISNDADRLPKFSPALSDKMDLPVAIRDIEAQEESMETEEAPPL